MATLPIAINPPVLRPILPRPLQTVAQYVALQSSALAITLEPYPALFGQDPRAVGAFSPTNRFLLSAYVTLTQKSNKAAPRKGYFGPLVITWDDGLGILKQASIGQSANPGMGLGFSNPISQNRLGVLGTLISGTLPMMVAPGSNVSVSANYNPDGIFSVNLALVSY